MSADTLVKVEAISRYYGDHCAVGNLSFTVQRGEVVGFLGPNGAGKTTTMQMLCGVLASSSGSVSIAGYDTVDQPYQAKRHLGFLPERPPLYREALVDEYLNYSAALRLVPRSRRRDAVADAKRRCGLQDQGGRLIANLSKGYQQRVGIAQAIIHAPDVVVLDEPTSGLDPNQIVEIRALIRELSRDHSVILSTHILPEVQTTCDRVLIINHGRLVLDEALNALPSDQPLQWLHIALQHPPSVTDLQDLDGVTEVTPLDTQRFRLACRRDSNTAAALARAAAQRNWGLYELIPQADSLEETFVQLTRSDYLEQSPQEGPA
jgi:ABC-2 type transport system ATP-binding protein